MARILIGLVSGLVFGVGLAISGMMNPAKVLGFLDVTGNWDPTLAFVMGGALCVTVPAFAFAKRRSAPFSAEAFQLPTTRDIDFRLVFGSVLFGAGWGLVGLCPGPAIAVLGVGTVPVFVFLASMLAGMGLFHLVASRISHARL